METVLEKAMRETGVSEASIRELHRLLPGVPIGLLGFMKKGLAFRRELYPEHVDENDPLTLVLDGKELFQPIFNQ